MKAVLQNFSNGDLTVDEVPPPALRKGGLLVRNCRSLISGGTERAVIQLARMNPLQKARTRPDLVKKVLDKAGQEGLLGTAKIVRNLVSAPIPLGYASSGIVEGVGDEVTGFAPGDRVACAGLGYANHAECVYVPRNLAVRVPDGVTFDQAAFATVGAIAVQAVRQAETEFGQTVLVIGLGLVGQIVSQVCLAAGCRVFGMDLDDDKLRTALDLGMHAGGTPARPDALEASIDRFTRGRGMDAVVIAASTKSSQPVEQAARFARNRAKVVALGDVGLNVPRRAYYEKELDLRQSRSYGPGRYDPAYEEHGQDYPVEYVRWTENRNMEAFLDLVDGGGVRVDALITRRVPIERATEAYDELTGEDGYRHLGIVLEYDPKRELPTRIDTQRASRVSAGSAVNVGVIGAGQFAQGVLLPALRKTAGARLHAVANPSGVTARSVAERYGADFASSAPSEIIDDDSVTAVMICGRHEDHAALAAAALRAGKHVFVEKPLALNDKELGTVERALRSAPDRATLAVGYNRRFSPFAVEAKEVFEAVYPLFVNIRVNGGKIPPDHWTQDARIGGGRVVGELCHFVDLARFFIDARPDFVRAIATAEPVTNPADPDTLAVQIGYENGSVATIQYVSTGDSGLPKERVEIFGGGISTVIDNWRALEIFRHGKKRRKRSWLSSRKGHVEEVDAFIRAVGSGTPPIPVEQLLETSRVTFAVRKSLRSGEDVQLKDVA